MMPRRDRKRPSRTPVRVALRESSGLREKVQDGIGAVKKTHHDHFAHDIRGSFGDSLDLDSALEPGHPNENRWDYLLGHNPSQEVVAVEPHSARQDEIATVIRKRESAKQLLVEHFRPGVRVSRWIWVASGRNGFADTEKARRRLDENGIEFTGQVQAKHLPARTTRRVGKDR